jgi:thiol-disulfide isomerase/thioredoxin
MFAAPLKVGDLAPRLKPGQWLQGEPVTEFSKDKVYLVEFWATSCSPCVSSIPHLNEIANKYKDKGLVVIGQNVWENDESKLESFLKEMGSKMTYPVAMDDKRTNQNGVMATTWLAAAGHRGIPTAFLIGKDGRIAVIDRSMSIQESVIEEVLAGEFDMSKAKADYLKQSETYGKTGKLHDSP